MIDREFHALVERRLAQSPVVVLLGPRQVEKTTSAIAIAARHPGATVLDLQRASNCAVL